MLCEFPSLARNRTLLKIQTRVATGALRDDLENEGGHDTSQLQQRRLLTFFCNQGPLIFIRHKVNA